MLRKLILLGLITALLTNQGVQAIDITWDGGDGDWDDLNWNNGQDIFNLTDTLNGSQGWRSSANEDEQENIIIPSGTVNYDADAFSSDFRMLQGSSLTITGGGTWTHLSNDDWSENRWTELDMSSLNIDNGTLRRVGSVNDEGGGALIFGSWRGNDTFNEPDAELDHQVVDISITNGGLLENEGQLWFGSWDDTAAGGTIITMTIDNGTVDLTGGDVPIGEAADADLVFTNRFTDDFDQPTYTINFIGPGSITVDESGIVNARKTDEDSWEDLDPITYQELWDAGILQANGKSGVDGENFNSFFTVTGQLGSDDYTLAWAVNNVVGDFNGDSALTGADIDALSAEVRAGTNNADFDLTGDGAVDAADRTEWITVAANTFVGDSNLDGEFNSTDFIVVFSAGEYEDGIAGNSGWAEGDWDGSGDFDSGDFVAAFSAGKYELGPNPAASTVPEPSALVLCALAGLAFLSRRK